MAGYRPGLDKANAGRQSIGVLLVNLGTPKAPTKEALKPYLKEFLSDPRVVEAPRLIWWLVLNGIILNTRPRKVARTYRKIWREDGSPLYTISKSIADRLRQALAETSAVEINVELAMRYGEPSISSALNKLAAKNATRLIILPLYPQYSATTTATTYDAIFDILKTWRYQPEVNGINHYFNEAAYIDAVASSIKKHWDVNGRADKLLFSFHSIPKRYSDQGDPYFEHCHSTAQNVALRLNLTPDQWVITFQSRFGKEEWLRPYTDEKIIELAKSNVEKLDVVCPGFAADCLETLEEIDVENRHNFLTNGGKEFSYIKALNDSENHVKILAELVGRRVRLFREYV